MPSRSAGFEFAPPALSDAQRKAIQEDDEFLAELEAHPDAEDDVIDGRGTTAKVESDSSSDNSSDSSSDSEADLAALVAVMRKRQKMDGEEES